MELIERDSFLSLMRAEFEKVSESEGHCILVSGEAGIGKTSLVKTFCKSTQKQYKIYQGTCDALFTPRPLGPILDIIWQMQGGHSWANTLNISDRSALFSQFHHELANQQESTIIVIEDIHWADEATLDFIKFFARRINRLHCLFILTYRDNEIHIHHPLRTVLGQLSPDSFTRLQLTPLSRQAVEKMSIERGYNGEDVYSISGGNPFYVNEILASYSIGVPDNIRDSVLSSFNRLDEKTKQIWEILSVLPTGFEIKYLEKMEPAYAAALHNCLDLRILIPKNGLITFKHELYRRTIENSLSPLVRMSLNKRILDLFRESFEKNKEIERIIHHAKNANENEIVVEYAPLAARQAAAVGAHIEASKLYLTAIEYYHGNDKDILLQFYESYAYECYLTNQITEAIIYATKALNLWKAKNDIERTGNCMRFLSRLWWYHGNGKKAETYADQAIQLLADQPSSRAKAMALSNISQLKMLSYEFDECISWGEKAIAMAKELADEEILCHALNNVGTTLSRIQSSRRKGVELLQQSLGIALKNPFDEHAGRAYVNLASNAVKMKDYLSAKKVLTEGIQYCEERDIDAYTNYLLAFKARLSLETGNWNEAYRIAENLIKKEDQPPVVKIEALVVAATIKMRRGDQDALPLLLEAKEKAFETMEPQRIIPAIVALLEYEWITGASLIEKADLDYAITLIGYKGFIYERSEFSFWLRKARKQKLPIEGFYEGYNTDNAKLALKASGLWKQLGCLYEQALTLFEGNDDDKREAIEIFDKLGAEAICEKMKFEMRASGIKKIPRGTRKSTKSNPANLTERELDVLRLLKDDLQNKEIAAKLFISPKTVDHHITAIFFKLEVNSRAKAVQEAIRLDIIK
jgi:predicted ATPase/DNA-binding CsgD family transcriptional regulator